MHEHRVPHVRRDVELKALNEPFARGVLLADATLRIRSENGAPSHDHPADGLLTDVGETISGNDRSQAELVATQLAFEFVHDAAVEERGVVAETLRDPAHVFGRYPTSCIKVVVVEPANAVLDEFDAINGQKGSAANGGVLRDGR